MGLSSGWAPAVASLHLLLTEPRCSKQGSACSPGVTLVMHVLPLRHLDHEVTIKKGFASVLKKLPHNTLCCQVVFQVSFGLNR